MSRYTWDYPTKGTRYPRTLQEAFGPYARMDQPDRGHVKSFILYCIACALALAAVIVIATY